MNKQDLAYFTMLGQSRLIVAISKLTDKLDFKPIETRLLHKFKTSSHTNFSLLKFVIQIYIYFILSMRNKSSVFSILVGTAEGKYGDYS